MTWCVIGFVGGMALSNLWQWLAWMQKNPGQARGGYWTQSMAHAGSNAIIDILILLAWTRGWLDSAVGVIGPWMPGNEAWWESVGFPLVPQIGVMLGFAADLFGDQAGFVLRRVLAARFPTLAPPAPTPAPPSAPTGG